MLVAITLHSRLAKHSELKQDPGAIACQRQEILSGLAQNEMLISQILAAWAGDFDLEGIGIPARVLAGVQAYARANTLDTGNPGGRIRRQAIALLGKAGACPSEGKPNENFGEAVTLVARHRYLQLLKAPSP